jgi:hypothetical protein
MAIEHKILTFGANKVGTIGGKLMGWDIYFQAKAFIQVANITDPTQITAINYLVKELVDNNLIGKFNFIYPMVGGDATKHSYNLIDTGLYRLTFNGGWTHSANGALPNGTNAWANTGFIPSLITGTNNAHFSYYSRTNSQVTNELLMGCNNFGAAPAFYLRIRDNTNLSQAYFSSTVVNQASATETDSRGLFMGNMQNATLRQLFKNKTVSNQNTNSETFVKNSANVYLASYNNNNTPLTFTNKECAFASIGNGMSNVEQALFYDIVQEYQTILGRNV